MAVVVELEVVVMGWLGQLNQLDSRKKKILDSSIFQNETGVHILILQYKHQQRHCEIMPCLPVKNAMKAQIKLHDL